MTGPAIDPYADTNALANRIAQHLAAHPEDKQARQDLRYIVSVMNRRPKDTTALDNPPEPSTGRQVAAGLAGVPVDMAKGLLNAILHPVQTAGQLTGVANIPDYLATARDPNASNAEKVAAVVQATPLNAGYAPMRAFLESLGYKTDAPPAPLSEQVRRGGDIAAELLSLRYGIPGTKRLVGAAKGAVRRFLPPPAPKPVSLDFTLLPPEPPPPMSLTNTPPLMSRPTLFPSGGLLDWPTFLRRGARWTE